MGDDPVEIDPMESVERKNEEVERELVQERAEGKRRSRLNAHVAITVALLATFMGICKVKDDNIVEAMERAEAERLDQWSHYQARNLREEIASSTLTMMTLQLPQVPPESHTAYEKQIASYKDLAGREEHKKHDNEAKADEALQDYERFDYRNQQFHLTDALIALSISLLAVTSLTQKWWLYWLAMIPTAFGILMGLSGLAGWHIHPDKLINLLS